MRKAILILLLALAAGCASVKVSYEGGMAMVKAKNTSWFLLNVIPIGTGNPDKPNSVSFKLFSDNATIESNIKLLEHTIKKENALTVSNITSVVTDEKIFVMLLRRVTFNTSAELIK